MRASLDTNAIIHFYKAGLQDIIFHFFDEGVFIYEQIRNVELEHHGQDILDLVDADIEAGNIQLYTDTMLREQAVYTMFQNNVNDNRILYQPGDLGEVFAISLAQTVKDFESINLSSQLNWSFKSQIKKFVNRFIRNPYKEEERTWLNELVNKNGIKIKSKFTELMHHL